MTTAKIELTPVSELARYSDLFERSLDLILIVDTSTNLILEANPSAERVLGLSQEKLVGLSIVDFVADSQKPDFIKGMRIASRRYYPRVFESLWKVLPTESKSEEIVCLLEPGKQLKESDINSTFEIHACALKLKSKQSVVQVIARDITFKKKAEDQLKGLLAELQVANQKLSILSQTDEMTKVFNYRKFKEMLELEHQRSLRYKSQYALLFFDLDHFKNYNDKNGHPAGDELLRGLAQLIQKEVRNTDLLARYGGEEFVVLCPEIDMVGAMTMAERIRSRIQAHSFENSRLQPLGFVSASIGVSAFPGGKGQGVVCPAAGEVLELADKAMYVSKKTGRNRVTSAESVDYDKFYQLNPSKEAA